MPVEHKLAVRDGARVREVLLVGTVTVGRSPTCEISSPDPRLSRSHAAFEVVDGEVIVRDLGSGNGTTVNGQPITEHRLIAGDQVEVGPFIVQLVETVRAVVNRRPAAGPQADEATVMMAGPQGRAPAAQAPVAAPPAAANPEDSSAATRMIDRAELDRAAAPAPPVAAPRATPPQPESSEPSTVARPRAVPPKAAPPGATIPPVAVAPSPVDASHAPPPQVRAAATELTFANTALLWVVPVVLISFLAGLVPDLLQPDARTPLLRAHYLAMATSAVDLVAMSGEPARPIDNVTSALRRQAGVTSARIIGTDGRVLAPLDQAGTTVPAPAPAAGAPAITEARDGTVEVQTAARTGDGRAVVVAMTIDPERIHPAPPGSIMATLLLILSLGAAWLVARRLTAITDSRLSRLGEEVELMTTRQISAGRDPFTLAGGTRILDAVTFALSSVGRVGGATPAGQPPRDRPSAERPAAASIEADTSFRIVTLDRECEGLLGIRVHDAPGTHLIDALPDQAVSNEVMRLLTMATSDGVVSGEAVLEGSGVRLGIDVTKHAGDAPLSIRFRRL